MMGASPGNLQTVKRERSSKGAYIYAATLDAVVSAVQNGAIEFHTWGATVPDIKHPDRITMDLDPDEALPWQTLVEGTLLTKTLMDGLGLKSFLKTTGGKGLHVVAPIRRELEWDEVKAFTQRIAEMLVKARPDLFTAKIAKDAPAEQDLRRLPAQLRDRERRRRVLAARAARRRRLGAARLGRARREGRPAQALRRLQRRRSASRSCARIPGPTTTRRGRRSRAKMKKALGV